MWALTSARKSNERSAGLPVGGVREPEELLCRPAPVGAVSGVHEGSSVQRGGLWQGPHPSGKRKNVRAWEDWGRSIPGPHREAGDSGLKPWPPRVGGGARGKRSVERGGTREASLIGGIS
jgi:hypothetical protein